MSSLKDKYSVTNVFVSAVTPENISRQQLLAWVNDALQSNLTKIEEMSTGAAYCMLTDRLFPGSIPLHKVKWNTKTDIESIANWKLVQHAWHDLGINKPVQVQVLLKGKFQDNFEFLQWFRRFYDHNNANYEYDPLEARNHEPFPISAGIKAGRAPVARNVQAAAPMTRRIVTTTAQEKSVPSAPAAKRMSMASRPATTANNTARPGLTAQQEAKYREEIGQLKDQISTWEKTLSSVENERDYYYQKLHKLELLCNDLEPEQTITVSRILAILYKEEDDGNDLQAFEEVEDQILHDEKVETNGVHLDEASDNSNSNQTYVKQAVNDTYVKQDGSVNETYVKHDANVTFVKPTEDANATLEKPTDSTDKSEESINKTFEKPTEGETFIIDAPVDNVQESKLNETITLNDNSATVDITALLEETVLNKEMPTTPHHS